MEERVVHPAAHTFVWPGLADAPHRLRDPDLQPPTGGKPRLGQVTGTRPGVAAVDLVDLRPGGRG
eukprot:CAMPEP_0198513438 /NCGR_PEP_ID=MMETSP1462-20131121/16058_1 /TAXON_ID=1333877 /ORGANISM="Brandtodinium nutriculum, Strain RCC3387" /LENGTH=64 /DNA_ID=CAMNT_0044242863 /DNA_START=519 /DNA_END=709 /DNA_ORIENTATION=-